MGSGDSLTHPILLHALSDGDNHPGDLVTQNERGFMPAIPFQQVSAADTAGFHPHQHLAGANVRHRHLLQPHILISVIHSYAHEFSPDHQAGITAPPTSVLLP
jgi:hypothetical protein